MFRKIFFHIASVHFGGKNIHVKMAVNCNLKIETSEFIVHHVFMTKLSYSLLDIVLIYLTHKIIQHGRQ